MKIVKLKGGLGNQMFQYSFAKLLQKRTHEQIKIDLTPYKKLTRDNVRKPRILQFQTTLPIASQRDLDEICILRHTQNSQTNIYRMGIALEVTLNKKYFFEKNRAFRRPETLLNYQYYDGYWQSWRYVEEVWKGLRKEFVPNYELNEMTKRSIENIDKQNAVFVGVRRGDYTKDIGHNGIYGTDYYRKAMNYIAKRVVEPVFYIFSNDIDWCKKNLDLSGYTVIYREPEVQTSDFEELLIMASCKHAVIVNSSFHWWGAWMQQNKNKIICCPTKWWADNKPIDIEPKEWVKID